MKRVYIFIWLASLLLLWVAASGFESPGYMDADYYFATGQQIAEGHGFNQPFLWNYLDNPVDLPHASHGYWMPMTTMVAALPMWLLKSHAFRVAQIPFILLASLLPVATVYMAYQFHARRRWAILSGLLAMFSGFYFIFFLTTDNFTLYAWIGGLVLWMAAGMGKGAQGWKWVLLGGLIGLAHLTRADGILLLFPVLWAAWEISGRRKWLAVSLVLAGVLLVELPWWIRNLGALGNILSPSNGRVLWLNSYNELFLYPADLLTRQHWLQSGLEAILQARLEALWLNLQHAIAEPGMIFLWPFVLVALREHRRKRWIQLNLAYFLLMLGVMTFVFPYAGGRGGVFHSSTAILPMVWVLAPIGLTTAIGWAAQKRGWQPNQAQSVFSAAAILLLAMVTLGLYASQVVDSGGGGHKWDQSWHSYQQIGEVLQGLDQDDIRVAVNNPPGFWLATGLEAVVIPDGDESTLRKVVQQFEIDFIILDQNVPAGLEGLFENPDETTWMELVATLQSQTQGKIWILEVQDR